jgi:hypothetical protein
MYAKSIHILGAKMTLNTSRFSSSIYSVNTYCISVAKSGANTISIICRIYLAKISNFSTGLDRAETVAKFTQLCNHFRPASTNGVGTRFRTGKSRVNLFSSYSNIRYVKLVAKILKFPPCTTMMYCNMTSYINILV